MRGAHDWSLEALSVNVDLRLQNACASLDVDLLAAVLFALACVCFTLDVRLRARTRM
jgi:hypothetical protein